MKRWYDSTKGEIQKEPWSPPLWREGSSVHSKSKIKKGTCQVWLPWFQHLVANGLDEGESFDVPFEKSLSTTLNVNELNSVTKFCVAASSQIGH